MAFASFVMTRLPAEALQTVADYIHSLEGAKERVVVAKALGRLLGMRGIELGLQSHLELAPTVASGTTSVLSAPNVGCQASLCRPDPLERYLSGMIGESPLYAPSGAGALCGRAAAFHCDRCYRRLCSRHVQCSLGPRQAYVDLGANSAVTGRRLNLCPGSESPAVGCWGCGHWVADGIRLGTGAPLPYDPATNYMAADSWRIDAKVVMVHDSGLESPPPPYNHADMVRRAVWFERITIPLQDYTLQLVPLKREALILHRDFNIHTFSRCGPLRALPAPAPEEEAEESEESESEIAEGDSSESYVGEEGGASAAGNAELDGEEDDETFTI